MEQTQSRFAYRCLPLLIANQSGWWILNSQKSGRGGPAGGTRPAFVWKAWKTRSIAPPRGISARACSPYAAVPLPHPQRLQPARPRAGQPSQGRDSAAGGRRRNRLAAGDVPMNWKFTRPNEMVEFEKEEPICMIVPQPRGIPNRSCQGIRHVRAIGRSRLRAVVAQPQRLPEGVNGPTRRPPGKAAEALFPGRRLRRPGRRAPVEAGAARV